MPRLFIALEPPPGTRRALALAQATLRQALEGEPIRWQSPDKAHLTLRFLGEVPDRDLAAITKAVREGCRRSQPFELATSAFGAFPSRQRPSVLWLGVGGELEPLYALVRRLAPLLEGFGSTETGGRFVPHLTLGRVRRPGGRTRQRIAEALELEPPEPNHWRADSAVLMESRLSPAGAEYRVLTRAMLDR